ncbi:hypothetical protein [Accumulibacter sp.]|uniref:hypothetical protein n=1 Tax=Accumulibacter sp. TaxID=2053492 RepID=UPI0025EF9961|nr:hypothetical protein [Accumulibacter sp.]MCM8614166.1 DUF4864 domain-containing protein [Accumulibacter sp.]MCM8637933.1 DUF4864 domain-containing protein [Accumulibacter sp.]MCM8641402.1 DUF4864 domain-containing protein [Accumulibacter sp.]
MPAASGATLTLVDSRPLAAGASLAPPPWPAGTRWRLDASGLRGPQPLACPQARQQILLLPAQGLFQGAWQADDAVRAQQQAAALGFSRPDTTTLRLECANGSFDLHRAAAERLLTALDGRVLVLRHRAAAGDAQAPVRELLLQHLSEQGSAFDAARVSRLHAWLAPSLSQAFRRWFARPPRPDEAPYLDGDPFTDTQEPPLSLTLGELARRGEQATQLVLVDVGAGRQHRLAYRLQRRDGAGWRITDIDYGDGVTLRQLMRKDMQP